MPTVCTHCHSWVCPTCLATVANEDKFCRMCGIRFLPTEGKRDAERLDKAVKKARVNAKFEKSDAGRDYLKKYGKRKPDDEDFEPIW